MKNNHKKKRPPIIPPDPANTDSGQEPTGEDLHYNEEADSFELDAETESKEYQHPDPYDTAVAGGGDHMSTYDEANPYIQTDNSERLDEKIEGLDRKEETPPDNNR